MGALIMVGGALIGAYVANAVNVAAGIVILIAGIVLGAAAMKS